MTAIDTKKNGRKYHSNTKNSDKTNEMMVSDAR